MQKTIMFFLIFLSLISLTNASIIISSNPIQIITDVGTPKNFSMTIANNYSFGILDFTFEDLDQHNFKFPYINLSTNETKQYSFEVGSTSSFYGIINSKVKFKFYVDLPEEIRTYQIQISDRGFKPKYITIRKGDTISWTNVDTITHKIYSSHFGTISIPPGSSNSFTFNTLGEFYYYDLDFQIFNEFNGDIEVVGRTERQLAHNPNYDYIWQVDLNAVSEPTTISIINSETYLEIEHAKTKKGLITIENTGGKRAEGVKLESNSDWIIFEKSDFNIESGEKEFIDYTISPLLSNTSQSDKNYTIEINIKAYNSNQENTSILLYVPYKEITGDLDNDIDTALWFENFYCPKHPCSVFCNPNSPECSKESGINGTIGSITANMSTIDLYNTIRDMGEIRQRLERLENEKKLTDEEMLFLLTNGVNISNTSLGIQQKNEKSERSRNAVVWWIILGATLIIAFWIILSRENKISEMKSWLGQRPHY